MANAHLRKCNSNTKLNWDAFIEKLTYIAKTQHKLHWDQKTYTHQVKTLLLQCNFPDFENVKKEIDNYENIQANWFEYSNLYKEVDFQVSLFQFEQGEYIPHHDHPDMTGVINVVSGNALLKNYTIEKQLEEQIRTVEDGKEIIKKKVLIKEIENEIAKAGDVSILTSHEGKIHSLMPNEFTQLMMYSLLPINQMKTIWYKVNEDGFHQNRTNIFEAEYNIQELKEVKTN